MALARLAPLAIEDVVGPAVDLAKIRADTSLRMPDCCVLLAAQESGDPAIATYDDSLRAVACARGLTVLP